MSLIYLLFCLFGLSSSFLTVTVEAIVSGTRAEEHQFLYQISVRVGHLDNACGGAIIDDRFVLTSALCFLNRSRQLRSRHISILAGTTNLNRTDEPAVTRQVEKVFFPSSLLRLPWYNIGVLKLAESLQLEDHPNLRKLNFSRDPRPNEVATIAGFGIQTYQNHAFDNRTYAVADGHLYYARVDLVSDELCVQRYNNPGIILRGINFCAQMYPSPFLRASSPYGVCIGDIGSPLVYRGEIIGILTRFAAQCNERYKPAIYTGLSYFSRMISNIMRSSRSPGMVSLNV